MIYAAWRLNYLFRGGTDPIIETQQLFLPIYIRVLPTCSVNAGVLAFQRSRVNIRVYGCV